MNLEVVGVISEIIGALAVVISLIYLALQIRAQNKQARLSALHEMSKEFREATAVFASDSISDVFVRANNDYKSISEAESLQLFILVTNLFRAWENAFLENKDGNLDKNVWAALAKDYSQSMGNTSLKHIWSQRKQNYNKSFQKYVEDIELQEYKVK